MQRSRTLTGVVVPGVVSGVLTMLSFAWFLINALTPRGPGWLGWVFAPAVLVITELQVLRLARSASTSPDGKRFWRHLAISVAVIIAATLVTAQETLSHPSRGTLGLPAKSLFGLGIAIILWALLRLPTRNPIRGTAMVRFGLDAAVVVVTVGVFGWYQFFRDYDGLASAVTTAGPVLALMLSASAAALVFAKLAIAGARGVDRRTMQMLGACVVVGSIFGGMLPPLASRPDVNASEVAVPLTYFLLGLTIERERSLNGRTQPTRQPRRPFSLAPYLAIAATDWLLLSTGGRSTVVTAVSVVLTAIVVGRQILAFYDNDRLVKRLDASLADVREAQLQLAYQANHDALTGLANRRLFEQQLSAATESAPSFAVVLIDLDDFKTVNDTLGHHVGDGLLIAVGERLRSTVGDGDEVARLGGDEFALLLGPATAAEPHAVLDRLARAMAAPVTVDGHELPVRWSVGLATSRPETGPTEMLRRADVAMYAAKAAGKGRSAQYRPSLESQPTDPVLAAPSRG